MAFIPNQLSSQLQITAESLPSGILSYHRTLAVMAGLVRAATTNYSVKQFTNRLLSGLKGHDFESEIMTLFFSLKNKSVMRAIRSTLSLCKTRFARSKRVLATVTTNARCLPRCSRVPVLCLVLCAVEMRRTLWSMFGLRFILTGRIRGSRLIRLPKARRLGGRSILAIGWNGRFFDYGTA